MCICVVHVDINIILGSEALSAIFWGNVMCEKAIPDSLRAALLNQGYSTQAVKELCKWFDSSKHKEVASF